MGPTRSPVTTSGDTDVTVQFAQHVLVPVADHVDARTTARVIEPYEFERITVLYVVEKGEGVPDKTPVEQSERVAAGAFDAFRETFPDAETEITYDRDVVEGIIEVADEIDASAIVFRPRAARESCSGSRVTLLHVADSADEGEAFLETWAEEHGLGDAALRVETGDVESAIERAATDRSMLIVGATERGLLSRLF